MNAEKFEARRVQRFWSKVNKSEGCWTWQGSLFAKTGYGQFWDRTTNRLAHRVSYELTRGPIPEGTQLDHLCRVRSCVNPQHLEPVSAATNNRRSDSPSARNARKTVCLRGHLLNDSNVYVTPTGGRSCRECGRARWRRYEAARKAARA